ncbi:hypothetical protein NDN08_006418 [Rhodosorus marinus]|uniref:NLE domain-containing protein n=1 Tax=Rhodosorus marinus TaxID=101924 RepID=A0AAV8UND9_9RHOD|nr:hypothetical protein NDN08_006418 [Rhodosorus marinus]
MSRSLIVQFKNSEHEVSGPTVDVPLDSSVDQLTTLLNQILENEERLPYLFYVLKENKQEVEIVDGIHEAISSASHSTETVLSIRFVPQALFRVRPVTRCTATLPAHAEAILTVQFSPNGADLATGSGDTTVRLWDVSSQTPRRKLEGHKGWVLCVAWSPDANLLASGSMDSTVIIWGPREAIRRTHLKGHKKWISSICWEPLHRCRSGQSERLASGSEDCKVRIWHALSGRCEFVLSGHTKAITCVRWGGEGLIYSSSQDRTIKVWSDADGSQVRSLQGHGHWVNTMALSTDYALRCGVFDIQRRTAPSTPAEGKLLAMEMYNTAKRDRPEKLVSGSDDFTLQLWEPATSGKPLSRMTGHQQLVNMVAFSPDQEFIASSSFDKSVRLWHASTGNFITTLRGHVAAVYQIAWSADSRLLLSSSKDSTVKVWELRTRKLKVDLPGHADEVYSVDWSPDGTKVASGGKDKVLKLWQN